MGLAQLVAALSRGDLTSSEVVAHALRLVERSQPVLNAFLEVESETASRAAREADAAVRVGAATGPLHGAPLAYKDIFDRPGRRATYGSTFPQPSSPAATAAALGCLSQAGGIALGALNMSEFALGATGHNAIFGACRNPWDFSRVSGGSSSGAAAAVAAGAVAGALGSDTGGSIRIPASCCGVTGLKPTQGRISVHGAMPLAPSLDCIGPLASSAEDCALLFAVLTNSPVDLVAPPALRIAYPARAIRQGAADEVAAALDIAAAVLAQGGATLVDSPAPDLDELHDLADVVQKAESAALHLTGLGDDRGRYSAPIRRRLDVGLHIPAVAYAQALLQRPRRLQACLATFLADADVIIMPTLGIPVPRIGETDEQSSSARSDLLAAMTRWTRWANYLGLPALSVPCGFDAAGLPIGLQIVGRPMAEPLLLAVAHAFQRRSDWHDRAPAALATYLGDSDAAD
jgi:aspartyl-tRNA(Asn)/glutamyl-tRNA(Gln) amidotransferase subunit A